MVDVGSTIAGASKIYSPHCAKCVECYYGWFGLQCERKCDGNCLITGCYKGVDEFRGNTCHETCPINCLLCEQDTGSCIECKMSGLDLQLRSNIRKWPKSQNVQDSPKGMSMYISSNMLEPNLIYLQQLVNNNLY